MPSFTPNVISEKNLSLAWAKAFDDVLNRSASHKMPLVLSISDFEDGYPAENSEIRNLLDDELVKNGKNLCETSAMVIFPLKFWNIKGCPNIDALSEKYLCEYLPRLKGRNHLNSRGTYFERMICFRGGSKLKPGLDENSVNQIAHIKSIWLRDRKNGKRPRQSALQISCFDPNIDHNGSALSGFPCLQQIGLTYDEEETLTLNAFYPTQFIFDRAYGNYLGLCHLGKFLSVELGLKFGRLNCFVGQPELGKVKKSALGKLKATVMRLIK